MTPRAPSRRRALAGAGLVVVVACGLGIHFAAPAGAVADIAGDALYAAAAYLVVVTLAPGLRSRSSGAIALAWCVAIELLQLTAVPAQVGVAFPLARLVLGVGFDGRDLVVYAIAVLVVAAIDAGIRGHGGRRPRRSDADSV